MIMETQMTVKLTNEQKEVISRASKLIGLGHSSFCRSTSLERAREILVKNHLNPEENPNHSNLKKEQKIDSSLNTSGRIDS